MTQQLGTVATCCKPNSGVGVVWMDIPLRGWVQPPAMKNGDRVKVLLPLSNFTRALDQPEQRRTEESLDTMEWSTRSWVWAPLLSKIFLAIFVFGILAIMFVLCTCAYSVSGVYIIICNVAACIWWHLLYLNFRNIARWLAAISKKKHWRSSIYLTCISALSRNDSPHWVKCSCYLGPGGRALRV